MGEHLAVSVVVKGVLTPDICGSDDEDGAADFAEHWHVGGVGMSIRRSGATRGRLCHLSVFMIAPAPKTTQARIV